VFAWAGYMNNRSRLLRILGIGGFMKRVFVVLMEESDGSWRGCSVVDVAVQSDDGSSW
jgi:hypothetical protein